MLRKIFKISFYALLVIIGVVFCVGNRGKIEITLFPLPYAVSLPLFVFAIAAVLAGILIGWSLTRIKTFKIIRAGKAAHERAAALHNELTAIRSEKLLKQR